LTRCGRAAGRGPVVGAAAAVSRQFQRPHLEAAFGGAGQPGNPGRLCVRELRRHLLWCAGLCDPPRAVVQRARHFAAKDRLVDGCRVPAVHRLAFGRALRSGLDDRPDHPRHARLPGGCRRPTDPAGQWHFRSDARTARRTAGSGDPRHCGSQKGSAPTPSITVLIKSRHYAYFFEQEESINGRAARVRAVHDALE
jgi:hypothetical protein